MMTNGENSPDPALIARLQAYWDAYRAGLPADLPPEQRPPADLPEAWYFCGDDDPACADELAELVRRGIKTATASLHWVYESEGEPLPQAGDYSIITTFDGEPVAIIQTTHVWIQPFNEVDARQAWEEGEGDRSLEYWRRVHWDFFGKECAALGRTPSQTMPVVCERFRLLHPAPPPASSQG